MDRESPRKRGASKPCFRDGVVRIPNIEQGISNGKVLTQHSLTGTHQRVGCGFLLRRSTLLCLSIDIPKTPSPRFLNEPERSILSAAVPAVGDHAGQVAALEARVDIHDRHVGCTAVQHAQQGGQAR